MREQPRNWVVFLAVLLGWQVVSAQPSRPVQVRIADGVLEGVVSADDQVRTFKGIPYAAPPVGSLRWKPPQPVQPWTGVRPAMDFGPRPMQGRIFSDMVFHDNGPSEDCLYLNLWMPEHHAPGKLPVMVWIYGGGFAAGATSEARQDGGNLSKKGVIVVSFGYRLGVFGFFALPELTQESEHQASGNYGLLDQVAALQWVKANIAAFGGDPDNVTIFGESAGSFSVSALMASPLSRGLFQRAIGESGAFFGDTLPAPSLAEAEAAGEQFAESSFYAHSLKDMRALPAKYLLRAALKHPWKDFRPDIDGYFLPTNCLAIYAVGQQSHVPLLAGWNNDEDGYRSYFTNDAPTLKNYVKRARAFFGTNAEAFLTVYPATTDAQVKRAAQDFAGDRFIGYSTWKWLEMQLQTGDSPVYRYKFEQTLPLPAKARPGTEPTAPHASDIEYVFEMLPSRHLPWRPEDRKVSELMADYWTNFAKTGNPNGPGLPVWPQYSGSDGYQVMHLSADPGAAPDANRARYEFLDQLPSPW
ncbi:MAG TPA: carboxylesterase family protein [Candidatus Acidoferrales bacterium]|nr:carboxylesterase family protein [Candidatus Acidoferrales bacterium]